MDTLSMCMFAHKRSNGIMLAFFMTIYFVYPCLGQGSFDYREIDHGEDNGDFPQIQIAQPVSSSM